jgi:pimeloyl-ACP methyl ester carboxylesterase
LKSEVRIRSRLAPALLLILPALLEALLLPGCAARQPELTRLYRDATGPPRPVILVPGVFGSRLRNRSTGELVWGSTGGLFRSLYRPAEEGADLLELPVDATNPLENRDALEPDGIFDRVAGRDFYADLLRTLREAGRYTPGDLDDPRPGEDLFAFDYDWRRDPVESAGRLAEAIERVLRARGDPEGKVDIVAHSLGGLVARYYIRYGGEDLLDDPEPTPTLRGARRIHRLVLIGAPNAGTLDALRSLLEGVRLVRRLPAEAIFTMPSAFALLPRPAEPIVIDESGEAISVDHLDIATWERFGWSVFDPEREAERCERALRQLGEEEGAARCAMEREAYRRYGAWALRRARRFIEALEAPAALPDPVRYAAFGGDCTLTPARVAVVEEEGGYRTYFDPESLPREIRSEEMESRMLAPGDGSVTRKSLLGLGTRGEAAAAPIQFEAAVFVCETHRHLTENATFQDNLLHLLLERR